MTAREVKNTIEHLAGDIELKARSYASAGRMKLASTVRRGQKIVEEKKSDLASVIEKTKNRIGLH